MITLQNSNSLTKQLQISIVGPSSNSVNMNKWNAILDMGGEEGLVGCYSITSRQPVSSIDPKSFPPKLLSTMSRALLL